MVIKATIMVAISTPLACDSLLVFINRKKAPKFKSAPILTNFVKTPWARAMRKESFIDAPVPKNNSDSVSPMALATKPTIIPMITFLLFKFPSI